MILFTATSAAVLYLSFGQLQLDYGLAALAIGLACTASGQLTMLWLASKIRSRSVIVYGMALLMGLSSLVLGAQGGFLSYAAARAHELWEWGNLCGQ